MNSKKILVVIGTRPNFIKVTQFKKVAALYKNIDLKIVHTGQHFDGGGLAQRRPGRRCRRLPLGAGDLWLQPWRAHPSRARIGACGQLPAHP